jgi:hypothetical protein
VLCNLSILFFTFFGQSTVEHHYCHGYALGLLGVIVEQFVYLIFVVVIAGNNSGSSESEKKESILPILLKLTQKVFYDKRDQFHSQALALLTKQSQQSDELTALCPMLSTIAVNDPLELLETLQSQLLLESGILISPIPIFRARVMRGSGTGAQPSAGADDAKVTKEFEEKYKDVVKANCNVFLT